jgi:serine protease inhibitor ecotin
MMIAAAHRLLRIVPSSGIRRTEKFQSIVRYQQARRCLSQQSLNINSATDEGGIKDEGVFLIGETLDSAADLQAFVLVID